MPVTPQSLLDAMGRIDEAYVLGPFRRTDMDTRGFRVHEYRTVEIEGYPQGTMQVFVKKYCCLRSAPPDESKWQPVTDSVSWEGDAWKELSWRSEQSRLP